MQGGLIGRGGSVFTASATQPGMAAFQGKHVAEIATRLFG